MFGIQYSISGEKGLEKFVARLWEKCSIYLGKKAVIFALEGPLGAGKTTFVKVLARKMGVKEEITSPSFILNVQYPIPGVRYRLEHIDVWKVERPEEIVQVGLAQMVKDKQVIAIEWAERVKDLIKSYKKKAQVVWIKIEYGKGDNERIITISYI